MTPALELTGIRKRYGALVAVDGASLTVRAGTIHALLGENGAGKSTLMRIAYGLVMPDEGSVRVQGAHVRFHSPADAMRAGIGMVQQHFALVPALSVVENVALGLSSGRQLPEKVRRLAGQLGVRLEPRVAVAELSVPEQQRVELLRALTRGGRVLILDEPTAALSPRETQEFFTWLRAFREGGGSAVLVTHKLLEALAVADEVSVLRQGGITWSGPREAASIDHLVTAMLGSNGLFFPGLTHRDQPAVATTDQPVAEARALAVRDASGVVRVRGADLRVYPGEILGVTGLEGSGSIELLYALAGRARLSDGSLTLPDDIGFVPDDRQVEALLLDESVSFNVALRGAGRRRGWIRKQGADARARRIVADGGVRVERMDAPVSTLSGGNQQRLILARELDGTPPLLVAVNPTRGLDVAATSEIQQRLRAASLAGMAIVYHSVDLDEVIAISDRVVVMYDGGVREVARDRAAIGRAMLGAA